VLKKKFSFCFWHQEGDFDIIASINSVEVYCMEISEKLAFEIFMIVTFHLVAFLVLFGFSVYIYFRSRKTPLLYSYLLVCLMIMVWLCAKVLKTVSPNEGLRWVFIVVQYFGIQYLGFFLLLFSLIYKNGRMPKKNTMMALLVLPTIAFLVVITNPWHMGFYSYYDFYKDRFGAWFYPTQVISYGYLFSGIYFLSRQYLTQPAFQNKKGWGRFFAGLMVVSIFMNLYYVLFKLSLMKWIFPFPVFDFTPIAATISIMLFMIPAFLFRFFDISPLSYGLLFRKLPYGTVFLDDEGRLFDGNGAFLKLFTNGAKERSVSSFLKAIDLSEDSSTKDLMASFLKNEDLSFEMYLNDGVVLKVIKKRMNKRWALLCFLDVTIKMQNQRLLSEQNEALSLVNEELLILSKKSKELAVAKAKTKIAQNMHDILGHSLTVVIGTAELAAKDDDITLVSKKLTQIQELLISSLNDLRNTFSGKVTFGQTSLIKAISKLKNQSIEVQFTTQGDVFEMDPKRTEAIFRLCQEAITNAIKHGKATTIHLILRYRPRAVTIYAVNNGAGCRDIVKSVGLLGIESRFVELGGQVLFYFGWGNGFFHSCVHGDKS
jgi:signal transduction histidine kinase